jgi:protein-S-isoprenylcysteine O-methyltransferase Ste14
MKKRIGIQGTLVFLSIILTVFLSKDLFPNWKKEAPDKIFDILGFIIILLGFLFRIVARGYKQDNSSGGARLIKEGPYELMRNPMYFGTLLIGLGVTSVVFQWWVFLLFLTVFFLIYFPQVKSEESLLSSRFGKEYEDYRKSTPRYFPNPCLIIKRSRQCIFFKWQWIKKELVSLVGIVSLVIFAEAWQDARLFGKEYFNEILESIATVSVVIVIIILFFHEKENSRRTK